jgi:hypothetical protein
VYFYILESLCQKAGQKQDIKIANRSFEDATDFKYLGTTLREEHKPRVFENRVLRRIFGPKMTGKRRKLHSEGLHNLCSSPDIIRQIIIVIVIIFCSS